MKTKIVISAKRFHAKERINIPQKVMTKIEKITSNKNIWLVNVYAVTENNCSKAPMIEYYHVLIHHKHKKSVEKRIRFYPEINEVK